MAKPPKAFDVWFVTANTVYREVPYQVVADWTQQGRLAPADMLRSAGSQDPWKRVAEWELLADYLPHPAAAVASADGPPAPQPIEIQEPADADYHPRRRRADDDDDVDMIPLIDISMVLLVFFIIVSATGALSPIDVPDMRYAGELAQDADAITISIEKASAEDVYYSVRSGKSGPTKENARLPNPESAIAALDSLLADRTRPPEVRVACAKDLPSERVLELARELKKRMDKRIINSFVATVNEAPQKK
ncbi:MAG: Biopolymer transport protein ExbD/TolR [Gemmataceae bacterium]|nr:Biopolymer transport protein ExbD/TolR [Gemmataceae bacterium]